MPWLGLGGGSCLQPSTLQLLLTLLIVLEKKSQYGIQHFILILHLEVGFKEQKKE